MKRKSLLISALYFSLICFGVLFWGCHSKTEPEKALSLFLQAVERRDHRTVWSLLSEQSREYWNNLAKQYHFKDGKELFLSGKLQRTQTLRRDPAYPSQIDGDRAVIFLHDELTQPIKVTLRRVKSGWQIDVHPRFF